MQDKRRFFSGATLEQAIANAARHYDVDPARLAYREREKKHGFLQRRRGVVVEVNPSALLVEAPAETPAEADSAVDTVADLATETRVGTTRRRAKPLRRRETLSAESSSPRSGGMVVRALRRPRKRPLRPRPRIRPCRSLPRRRVSPRSPRRTARARQGWRPSLEGVPRVSEHRFSKRGRWRTRCATGFPAARPCRGLARV